jgi:hypothetical protein
MINLKEEKDSLKAQLQHERENILLVKSQYEDTLKHQREMLNETRKNSFLMLLFDHLEPLVLQYCYCYHCDH